MRIFFCTDLTIQLYVAQGEPPCAKKYSIKYQFTLPSFESFAAFAFLSARILSARRLHIIYISTGGRNSAVPSSETFPPIKNQTSNAAVAAISRKIPSILTLNLLITEYNLLHHQRIFFLHSHKPIWVKPIFLHW